MTNTTTVQDLFDTYADALSRIDLDAIATCYHYPALAVTRLGCQSITDEEMTKEFFEQNSQQYKQRGIDAMRFENIKATYDEDGLWIGFADITNLDADGKELGVEHNAYQLVETPQGWRIAVTTPLDAR